MGCLVESTALDDAPGAQGRELPFPRWLPWVLIAVGAALRIAHYASNRSLWIDEAMLAPNIIDRSVWDVFAPLHNYQGCPPGFLVLARLAVAAFGRKELALRLVPLLSGLLSLYLFWVLARRWLAAKGALFALGLFAIAGTLVYYSAEAKQYSTDVLCAVALYLVVTRYMRDGPTVRVLGMLAVTGAVAIWVSHPAAFILAGVGTTLALDRAWKRQWVDFSRLSAVGAAAVGSSGVALSSSSEPQALSTNSKTNIRKDNNTARFIFYLV